MTEGPRVYFVMREFSRFGYEISVFLKHNRAVFKPATGKTGSYVTGTVS